MPAIEAVSLRKSFGTLEAVKGISLTVGKGELFGLLGPNGAGKTTTIHMLTGLARPDSGETALLGISGSTHMKKIQQHIGVVPDESNVYDELTGFENLTFCASLYGMEKKRRGHRAKELLDTFSLTDAGSRPVKTYSKGMKRKLVIAAGIIHSPPVLFLDEPTTGIDVESAQSIRALITYLNRQGTTILLTTHYLEEAERLCSRIGFMDKGKIITVGSKDELLERSSRKKTFKFSLSGNAHEAAAVLSKKFPHVAAAVKDKDTLEITAEDVQDISPFIREISSCGIPVLEAKLRHLSLEEVFVALTGSTKGGYT